MSHDNISSKTCFKCGMTKSRTDFYKHAAMADGLLGKCISCTKKDVNAHRIANLETIRTYDRERAKNPERIALAAEINRRWRIADKRRVKAHNAVARAIRNGDIIKMSCIVCASEKSMAHHESYDEPLQITWYCQIHHKARHKQMVIDDIEP